jgi:hypothetical protein
MSHGVPLQHSGRACNEEKETDERCSSVSITLTNPDAEKS